MRAFRLGLAYEGAADAFVGTLDAEMSEDRGGLVLHAGAETWFKNVVAVRLGARGDQDAGEEFVGGLGFRIGEAQLDYAFTPYGRLGDCILSRLGCGDLVADDADGYVATAVALARDPIRLDDYRRNLRGRFAASTLLESPQHLRELEAVIRGLWREWCVSPSA